MRWFHVFQTWCKCSANQCKLSVDIFHTTRSLRSHSCICVHITVQTCIHPLGSNKECANTVSGVPALRCLVSEWVGVHKYSRHNPVCSALVLSLRSPAIFFLLLLLLLKHLLSAGSWDVQESPGCVRVQLLLVTTQRPNVHHPQHLLLWRKERNTVWV